MPRRGGEVNTTDEATTTILSALDSQPPLLVDQSHGRLEECQWVRVVVPSPSRKRASNGPWPHAEHAWGTTPYAFHDSGIGTARAADTRLPRCVVVMRRCTGARTSRGQARGVGWTVRTRRRANGGPQVGPLSVIGRTRTRPERDHVMFRKVELEHGLGSLLVLKNHDDILVLPLGPSCFIPFSTLVMWAKLSNVLKHRPTVDESEASSPDVVSTVQEKHSAPHNNDDGKNRPAEVPFPVPSPPGSPSRHRNGVFRRMSRSAKHDSGEPSKASSALKLPLRLPKKVKSHISLHTNSRCIPAWDSFYYLPGDHYDQCLKFLSTLHQIL
jgi:hypothetical protein